jgi:folate-binding protein YgfZ
LPYAGSCFLALNPDVAGAGLPSPDAAEARAALEAVRLEAQWPWWGVEISEANLPQEIGRDAEAISFRKGCYLGQETIARLDALGHVNQQLRWLRLEGAADVPAVGTPLVAAEGSVEAGRVASACWSPRYAGPVAAALVRTAYAAPGTRLQCGAASAEVLPSKA